MPYFEFVWTDEIIKHIAEHDISQEDFEEVVCRPVGRDESVSSGLSVAFGYTLDGRNVIAVFEMIDDVTVIPVTAYEVEEPW